MIDIARRYCALYPTTEQAMARFAYDLMRGDPASFKAGYSRANAVIATAEAFDVPRKEVEALIS